MSRQAWKVFALAEAALLSIQNLGCQRGDEQVFDGVDLQLRDGEILQIAGANGSGKTTLLRSLCGLFDASYDRLSWRGEMVDSPLSYADELLYIGHRPATRARLTVLENLQWLASLNQGSDVSRWPDCLRQLSLEGYEHEFLTSLSAGQKRRVALARLQLTPVRLWVLDEPFASLDRAGVELLRGWITDFVTSGGSLIYSTHQDVEFPGCPVRVLDLSGFRPRGDH